MSTTKHFIAIGPYCWGKAATSGAAIRGMKRAYPGGGYKAASKIPYYLYEVPEDAYVTDSGEIMSSEKPRKIRHVDFVGDQRVVKEKFDEGLPEVRGEELPAAAGQ